MKTRYLLLLCLLAAAGYFGAVETGVIPALNGQAAVAISDSDRLLASAFENQLSNLQVRGEGRVTRILPDDDDGSRHQRFIVRLASGQTLLVTHNIDVAERVASLQAGDRVEFNGEYEWNPQGGVIHWTHRDPRGKHVDGWLKHSGRTYQ